jgi:hypothetical protein
VRLLARVERIARDSDAAVVVSTGTHLQPGACAEQRQSTTSKRVSPAPFGYPSPNVSCREARSLVSADTDQSSAVANGSNSLSPSLRATLGLMGVSDGAFEGWEAFHVSPVRAMLYFFVPASIVIASISYLQFVGVPLRRLYISIPSLSTLGFMCGYVGALWRYGPAVARNPLFLMTIPFSWCSGFLALALK